MVFNYINNYNPDNVLQLTNLSWIGLIILYWYTFFIEFECLSINIEVCMRVGEGTTLWFIKINSNFQQYLKKFLNILYY